MENFGGVIRSGLESDSEMTETVVQLGEGNGRKCGL